MTWFLFVVCHSLLQSLARVRGEYAKLWLWTWIFNFFTDLSWFSSCWLPAQIHRHLPLSSQGEWMSDWITTYHVYITNIFMHHWFNSASPTAETLSPTLSPSTDPTISPSLVRKSVPVLGVQVCIDLWSSSYNFFWFLSLIASLAGPYPESVSGEYSSCKRQHSFEKTAVDL